MRQHVNAALEQAARDLGLPTAAAVVDLLEQLAEELGYIEALREGLLNRVRDMVARSSACAASAGSTRSAWKCSPRSAG